MFEELIKGIKKRQIEIEHLQEEQRRDVEKLEKLESEDLDLISIKRASQIFDLSITKFYELVNNGKLKRYDIGGKVYISKKEIIGSAC